MKLKLLLLFFLVSCVGLRLFAQAPADTIRNLVISEARISEQHYAYVEIANRGTTPIDLSKVSFGSLTPWTTPWNTSIDRELYLPKKVLQPGKTVTLMDIYDLPGRMVPYDPEKWLGRQETPLDYWQLADVQIHVPEPDYGAWGKWDSISPTGWYVMGTWNGRDAWFLRQHFSDVDSIVIDELNASFTQSNGNVPDAARNVAGVTNATANQILYRKYTVKTGDLGGMNWAKIAGVDMEDSQWLTVPAPSMPWGKEGIKQMSFWTIGNDGDIKFGPTTLTSNYVDVNFVDTVMTIPWGTRNGWKVMTYFDRKPGIAWRYSKSLNREDSAYSSVRTGDILRLYAVGNKLQTMDFKIVVTEPTADANLVIPKIPLNNSGYYTGQGIQFQATYGDPKMDTIYDVGYGYRADSLLKYLEKAPAATWEVVPVDGVARPDLKTGDVLKVTSKSGKVKNYYIAVDAFRSSHTASLTAITWPDIPPTLKGFFGWVGDTIPKFNSGVFGYNVTVPVDYNGIPALVPKVTDVDTKIEMTKVKNLYGSPDDRTVSFKATAEDDSTVLTYKVMLEKELPPSDIQPFVAEPFFSQYTNRPMWAGAALEICNPGNQPLDLSNYLLVQGGNDGTPANAISNGSGTGNFRSRYNKYIPGRTWATSDAEWQTAPYRAKQDLAVNPIVQGGDVFTCAALGTTYNFCDPYDVDFYSNPWGDTLLTRSTGGNIPLGWINHTMYMFKILNDSVRDGTKSVGDPNDFQLIEVFGNGDGTNFVVGGFAPDQLFKYERRPQYWEPKPTYKGSFGTTTVASPKRYPPADDGEWNIYDRPWYGANGYSWPRDCQAQVIGLGTHTFNPLTHWKSTITTLVYKASTGYSANETIKGVLTGTTATQFLAGITKADAGQTLTLKSGTTVITGTTAVKNGDVLEVTSKDGKNVTKYKLSVDANGLSKNAVLTSTTYTVGVSGSTGTVGGYAYGTLLKNVVAGVTVPAGATMVVVDNKGNYVPYKMLNFDTLYVDVTVNDKTFFEVTAEDNVTKIVYQLKPNAASTDAFVESNVYSVDQTAALIKFVPIRKTATAVRAFLSNLIPATGATMKVVDNKGNQRVDGNIYLDDKLVVTAADGVTKKVYYLSELLYRENIGQTIDYLAYVLSNVYKVDQQTMLISNIPDTYVLRPTFLNNLIPAAGATAVVVNSSGVVSTKADIDMADKVKVTAANGINVAYYSLLFINTSVNGIANKDLKVYPNPTTGVVNIGGLESGNRIRIFNAMGANISSMVAGSSNEVISLQDQPNGIYMILVENANQLIGRFKLVKN